jgi:hydroxymethylglutaryl-CoA reductase
MPGERWAAVVDLEADVRDIMGANKVTLSARAVGVELEKRYGVKALAPIVGNDAPERAVKARAVWRREALGFDLWKKRNPDASGSGDFALSPAAAAALGEEGIAAFLRLQAWAEADPRRAVTHNKGIMNGVDAVATAVAQDTRAIEAGFWAEACRTGACRPMTRYRRLPEGHLVGVLKMPLAVGVHGGATRHPIAAANLEAMRVRSAEELAHVIGAVGLAQNFAALWCLAHEGIPAAHARLDKHRP